MKNKIVLIYSAVLALSPFVAWADLDPSTLIQDKINVYQEELNKITKEYIGQEVNLQQMINSRDKLGELKKLGKNFVIDQAMQYGSKIKIRSVAKKGLSKAIKGSVATPQLSRLVGRKMTKKVSESNDAAKARQYKEEMNDLVIENVATMFAKALVLRRAIMNETESIEEEEKTELTDLTQIEDAYKVVANRANGRWKTILDAQSNYYGQQATISMIGISVDKKEEEEEAKTAGDDLSADDASDGKGNMSVTDLYKKGKDTVGNIKSGNYGAALGNLGEATSGVGAGTVGSYIGKAGNLYNTGENTVGQVKSGNYGAAAGTALGGVVGNFGDKFGDKTSDVLGKVGKGLNASDNVVSGVKSGNYGDALSAVGSTTGELGAGKVGDYIGRAGNAYNKGSQSLDQIKSGNYGAAAGTALGGVSDTIGDKIGGNAGNVIKGTSSALGSADGAVDAIKNKKWKNAWQNIERGYHDYENASGRKGEEEKSTPASAPETPASTKNNPGYSQWNYGGSPNVNNNTGSGDANENYRPSPLLPTTDNTSSETTPSPLDYGSFAGGNGGSGGGAANNNNTWVSPLLPTQQTGSNN